uniref:Neur_chan_LBD domain-containing protein n=1 Tax=Angiostrongylus cantonensis TaxID=6313 RepID=A0A158PCJ0_ANGCA
MLVLMWIFGLLAMVMCQPFYGLEKQILYGFQDPDEIQWRPDDMTKMKRVSRRLNLLGLNARFTDPFRLRMIKKKIRSVQLGNDFICGTMMMDCPEQMVIRMGRLNATLQWSSNLLPEVEELIASQLGIMCAVFTLPSS